jgi:5-methylcytosine-specific restriction enzyme B
MNIAPEYLKKFALEADARFKRSTFLRDNYEFFRNFFKRENLEKAEWPDIQKIGQHLHCFNSIALARTRALGNLNHSIEHYRKSFIYLAHGPGEPAERIRLFCNDKEYQLKYFGKSAVSELIGYLFPDQFLFANARDEFAVRFLGIQVQKNASDDLVSELQAFSNAARPLALQYKEIVGKQTDLPLFLELDQFFSWLYENFAGKEPPPPAPTQYWTFSAGRDGDQWEEFYEKGIMAIGWEGTPDLRQFKNKEEIRQQLLKLYPAESSKVNDSRACWQFVHDIKKGDIIFAKQGLSKILGYGVVQSEYIFDSQRSHFKHVRQVKWIAKGEWEMPEDSKMAAKTLTNITPYPEFICLIAEKVGLDLGREKEPGKEPLQPVGIAYWWLNANPKIWNFEETPVGQKETYTSRNDQGNKRQKYKYFQEVKPGDIVVGYVTSPQKEVVAVCKITKGLHQTNKGEEIEFEKIEQLASFCRETRNSL